MTQLLIALILQASTLGVTAPQENAPAKSDETEKSSQVATGPLRVELAAMFEGRYWYEDPSREGARESEMRLQFRVAGEKVAKISRHGNPVITEMVDSTGKELIDPDEITDEQREETRLVTVPAERMREDGLLLVARADAAAREAKSIKKIRGTIRALIADDYEEITIANPKQYTGKLIEHPRLSELGIEVRVVSKDELDEAAPLAMFILEFKTKKENVRDVAFYDAWMKPLRSRERPLRTQAGKEFMGYALIGRDIGDDFQLVLQVFPQVEDVRIPIELNDVPLP